MLNRAGTGYSCGLETCSSARKRLDTHCKRLRVTPHIAIKASTGLVHRMRSLDGFVVATACRRFAQDQSPQAAPPHLCDARSRGFSHGVSAQGWSHSRPRQDAHGQCAPRSGIPAATCAVRTSAASAACLTKSSELCVCVCAVTKRTVGRPAMRGRNSCCKRSLSELDVGGTTLCARRALLVAINLTPRRAELPLVGCARWRLGLGSMDVGGELPGAAPRERPTWGGKGRQDRAQHEVQIDVGRAVDMWRGIAKSAHVDREPPFDSG